MNQQIMPMWAGLVLIALFCSAVIAIGLQSPSFFGAVKRCITLALSISVLGGFAVAYMLNGSPVTAGRHLLVVSGLSGLALCTIVYGIRKAIASARER
jgi:hypothetical protein